MNAIFQQSSTLVTKSLFLTGKSLWQNRKNVLVEFFRSPVALSVISFINASDTKAIEAVFPQNEEAVYTVEYIQDDDTTLSS